MHLEKTLRDGGWKFSKVLRKFIHKFYADTIPHNIASGDVYEYLKTLQIPFYTDDVHLNMR